MKKKVLTLSALCAVLAACSPQPQTANEPSIDFAPVTPLNPPTYICYKAPGEIKVDGKLTEWDAIPWTSDFVDIEGDKRPAPHFQTRAKMAYDENGMYFAALMDEPHVWAYQTEHDCVIFKENDFEIFIDAMGSTHNYLEYEINANGTDWDLYLSQPYRNRPCVVNNWEYLGKKVGVHVDGTLNNPSDTDKAWSIEVFFPWSALNQVRDRAEKRPQAGDQFRVNFSRVEWTVKAENGKYVKIPIEGEENIREYNWVWAPTGVINIHLPEYWGYVQFSDKVAGQGEDTFQAKPEEATKWILRQLYYRQKEYQEKTGHYAASAQTLKASDLCSADQLGQLTVERTSSLFEITLPAADGTVWRINQDGLVWK